MNELNARSRLLITAALHGHDPAQQDMQRIHAQLKRRLGTAIGAISIASTVGTAKAAGSASVAAAGITKTGTIVTPLSIISKIVIGMAVGVTTYSGYHVLAAHKTSSATQVASVSYASPPVPNKFVSSPSVAPPAATVAGSASVGTSKETVAIAELEKTTRPSTSETVPSKSVGSSAAFPIVEGPSLAAEAHSLIEAQSAIQQGSPERALAMLDEQNGKFHHGGLDEERAAARILALCQLGRVVEARTLIARFLKESPNSVLNERIIHACDAL